ncbi:aldose epimerase family protein [Roseobacter sp.]|uniref:aldose epimerase family protein n=1 Tax=Roseobacter sp. TaxID=1907202 RepID=UPI003296F27A
MTRDPFGTLDGVDVAAVTLSNGGLTARFITYGARLTQLWVPDAIGTRADVVLGFDDLQGYVQGGGYLGAVCGQYANRVANGQCRVAGHPVHLDTNEGVHHLHGGSHGFDSKIWEITALADHSVTFSAVSEDGEMGFPGRSCLTARYTLTPDAALDIELTADTDAPTLMNMTNHAYFNLAGYTGGDVLGHHLGIASGFYTPVNDALLATGEVRHVGGTPYDFQTSKPIGQDIVPLCPVMGDGGYDHNWCLNPCQNAVRLFDPGSGRRMTLTTTEPGVQVYTGGAFDGQARGKGGHPLHRFAGVALEPQKYPCSPNFAHFPDATLWPGQIYRHHTRLQFSADAH